MRALVGFELLITALTLSACSFSFDEVSEVKDRRILAVQTEPAELTATSTATINVRALVVDPTSPTATVEYAWAYCTAGATANNSVPGPPGPPNGVNDSNATSIRCPSDNSTITADAGSKTITNFEIAQPVALPENVLTTLASGDVAPQLEFNLQLTLSSPEYSLYALKNIPLSPALISGQTLNSNPAMDGLTFDGIDWIAGAPLIITYGQCTDDKLRTAPNSSTKVCSHEIKPIFQEAEAQTYVGRNIFTGNRETTKERLRFAWFADGGKFERNTTNQPFPAAGLPFDDGITNVWLEPLAAPQNPISIWMVARDERGGVSWISRQVQFQ